MNSFLNAAPATLAPTSLRTHPEAAAHCDAALKWFMSHVTGVTAALVATTDGFEIAAIRNQGFSLEKMSAMSSSMLALGGAVLREAQFANECQNVVIDGGKGLVVMLAVGEQRKELLLAVAADNSAMLGQVLWASRSCCDRIRQSINTLYP